MPVQLWRAEDDEILPDPFYASPSRVPAQRRLSRRRQGRHFDFLTPCNDYTRGTWPSVLQRPSFDRAAFHGDFNKAKVVAFFEANLPPHPNPSPPIRANAGMGGS
jgi:hypothetical protein